MLFMLVGFRLASIWGLFSCVAGLFIYKIWRIFAWRRKQGVCALPKLVQR